MLCDEVAGYLLSGVFPYTPGSPACQNRRNSQGEVPRSTGPFQPADCYRGARGFLFVVVCRSYALQNYVKKCAEGMGKDAQGAWVKEHCGLEGARAQACKGRIASLGRRAESRVWSTGRSVTWSRPPGIAAQPAVRNAVACNSQCAAQP